MNAKEYPSDRKNATLTAEQAKNLRIGIESKYKIRAPTAVLGSREDDYKLLSADITKKHEGKVVVKYTDYKGNKQEICSPTSSFLKKFCYENKSKTEITSRQYNMDLCCLYAFDCTYDDFIKNKHITTTEDSALNTWSSQEAKVIVSLLHGDITYGDLISAHFESPPFYAYVDKDIRDVSKLCKGSLHSFLHKPKVPVVLFVLLSKIFLYKSKFLSELIDIKKNHPKTFERHIIIIYLDDICTTDFDVQSQAKIQLISLYEKREEELLQIIESKKHKKGARNIDVAKIELQYVSNIMDNFNDFITEIELEKKFLPYNLFTTYFKKDDLQKLLNEQKINWKGAGTPSEPGEAARLRALDWG